jgi:hypothetical protein
MFVFKHNYYGVPAQFIKQLEQVTQGTVNRLFELAQIVYDDETIKLWNCSVERSVVPVKRERISHKRLLITNHSAGWWVVIEFGQHYPEESPDIWDFWLFESQTDNDYVHPENVDWEKFLTEWGYGRTELYWQAQRINNDDAWYSHAHQVSFTHPLLLVMENALRYKDLPR